MILRKIVWFILVVFLISGCATTEEDELSNLISQGFVSEDSPNVSGNSYFNDVYVDDDWIEAIDKSFVGMSPQQVALCESVDHPYALCRVVNVLGFSNDFQTTEAKRNCVWFAMVCVEMLVEKVEEAGGELEYYSRNYHMLYDISKHTKNDSKVSWIVVWTTLSIDEIYKIEVPTYSPVGRSQ